MHKLALALASLVLLGTAAVAAEPPSEYATGFPGQAASEPKQADSAAAEQLFKAGKFAEAGKIYAQVAAQDPKDYAAILQLGRVALLSNRLDEARELAEKGHRAASMCRRQGQLAEAFYRGDVSNRLRRR